MGYTKVDNAFIEKIVASDLTSLQIRIVLVALRKTFGFQKKIAPLSSGYLAKATNSNRRSVLKATKSLRIKSVLVRDPRSSIDANIACYELNTKLSTWQTRSPFALKTGEPKSLEYAGSEDHYKTFATHQILKKYKISKDQFDDIYTEFLEFVSAEGKAYLDYPAQLRRWVIREAKDNKFEKQLRYARYS